MSPALDQTHRVEVAWTERAAILEYLVEALLHCRQLVGLQRGEMRAIAGDFATLTIGINSSETGSLDESSRYIKP